MNPLIESALAAADAGARVLRRAAGGTGIEAWEEKAPADFVTGIDRRSQDAVLAVIRERHPGHAILAEEDRDGEIADAGKRAPEDGSGSGDDRLLWVVDPLDGTTNFIHGHPAYAVSVAVVRRGKPVAGAVVAPATGERWWAAEGEGAFLGGRRIRTSGIRELDRALVGTGFPFRSPDRLPEYLPQLERIIRRTTGVRRCGAAALDLCYLACGRLDAFWELELAPWDVMAGIVIVREAGGRVTRIDGSDVSLAPGSVLGSNYHMFTTFASLVRGE